MNQEKLMKIVKSREWFKWGSRRMTTRLGELWIKNGVKNFRTLWGRSMPDQVMLIKDLHGGGYLDDDEFSRFKSYILKRIEKDGFYKYYETKAIPVFKFTLNYARKLRGTNYRTKTNGQLLKIYKEFILNEGKMMHYLWIIFIFDFALSDFFKDKLKSFLIKAEKPELLSEMVEAVSMPTKQTDSIIYKRNLLKASLVYRNNYKKLDSLAKLLTKKYAYFPILNYDEKPFDENFFKDEIIKFTKNLDSNLEAERKTEIANKKLKNKYKAFIRLAGENEELIRLGQACQKVAYYRDYRNEVRRKLGWSAIGLYKEIAKRLKIELEDLLMYRADELEKSLIKGEAILKKTDLEKRNDGSVLFNYKNKFYTFFGGKILKTIYQYVEEESDINDIKGIVAYKGLVKAKAKIIMSVQRDGAKLKQGDILVTSMTNLDFLALISKASAIITDEGSLLSHAAITARELKKPCIVGTKIATKVLHDGDYVEVDANRGVIRKVKK